MLAIVLATLVCGSVLSAGLMPARAVSSHTITVRAVDASPTSTGVTVAAGQHVTFSATGTWCLSDPGAPTQPACGGPAGIRATSPGTTAKLVLDSALAGALVGRAGDGPWFEVGAGGDRVMPSAGPLVLQFNDIEGGYGDNSGDVAVTLATTSGPGEVRIATTCPQTVDITSFKSGETISGTAHFVTIAANAPGETDSLTLTEVGGSYTQTLIFSGTGDQTFSFVAKGTTLVACLVDGPGPGDDEDDLVTVEAAPVHEPTFIALGDSFGSGQGHAVYDLDASCARSSINPPHQVAVAYPAALINDVTCGGARTDHFKEGQTPTNGPQLDALANKTPDFVTVSVGGNDFGALLCRPGDDQASIFTETHFGGGCNLFGRGLNRPDPGFLLLNSHFKSIRLGRNVEARLCYEIGGPERTCVTAVDDSPDLTQIFPAAASTNLATIEISDRTGGPSPNKPLPDDKESIRGPLVTCGLTALCIDIFNGRLQAASTDVQGRLKTTYSELRKRLSASTRIYVVGYPQVMPKRLIRCGLTRLTFSDAELEFLRAAVTRLNLNVQVAVSEIHDPNLIYLNIEDATAGHEACTEAPFVNDLELDGLHIRHQSFHPNEAGSREMGTCLARKIRNDRSGSRDPDGFGCHGTLVDPPATFETLATSLPGGPIQPPVDVTVSGAGLRPLSPALTYVASDATLLATLVADEAGEIHGTVTLPAGLAPGTHTLYVRGTAPDGAERFLTTPFVVPALPLACGATLTQDTLLDADLHCPAGNALIIGADGIAVDLNGHTITGSGSDPGSGGIDNPGFDGVSILNGTVDGFGSGIRFKGGADDGFVATIHASSNLAYGIVLSDSDRNVVDGNIAVGNGSTTPGPSSAGIGLIRSNENHLEENYLVNNADGLLLVQSNRNTIQENRSCDRGCDGNAKTGVVLVDSDDNNLFNNEASENVRAGIFIDQNSTANSLGGNLATNNGGIGINTSPTSIDLGGNRASDNRGPVQCRNVACQPAASPP